jgi:hypothetical protein
MFGANPPSSPTLHASMPYFPLITVCTVTSHHPGLFTHPLTKDIQIYHILTYIYHKNLKTHEIICGIIYIQVYYQHLMCRARTKNMAFWHWVPGINSQNWPVQRSLLSIKSGRIWLLKWTTVIEISKERRHLPHVRCLLCWGRNFIQPGMATSRYTGNVFTSFVPMYP